MPTLKCQIVMGYVTPQMSTQLSTHVLPSESALHHLVYGAWNQSSSKHLLRCYSGYHGNLLSEGFLCLVIEPHAAEDPRHVGHGGRVTGV